MTKKWRCTVCNYIHEGDNPPDQCPVCGAGAEFFELIEEKPQQPEKKFDLQSAIFKISYGLFIISSTNKYGKYNGQCCNTLFQITSEPLQIGIGINKKNLTHEFIAQSGILTAAILDQQGHGLVKHFGYQSGRTIDKFAAIPYFLGETGIPVPEDACAYLEARINFAKSVDLGTHTLFIADVIAGGILKETEPMTYAYYRKTR